MSIFKKIINREIPAEIVYENDRVLAFRDIHPQAPIHVLFIHKEETTNILDLVKNKPGHLQDIFQAIEEFTKREGLDSHGFRLVTNCGKNAGQTVFHTHFHLLAGGSLSTFGQ